MTTTIAGTQPTAAERFIQAILALVGGQPHVKRERRPLWPTCVYKHTFAGHNRSDRRRSTRPLGTSFFARVSQPDMTHTQRFDFRRKACAWARKKAARTLAR